MTINTPTLSYFKKLCKCCNKLMFAVIVCWLAQAIDNDKIKIINGEKKYVLNLLLLLTCNTNNLFF